MIYVTLFTQTVCSERASKLNKLNLKGGWGIEEAKKTVGDLELKESLLT